MVHVELNRPGFVSTIFFASSSKKAGICKVVGKASIKHHVMKLKKKYLHKSTSNRIHTFDSHTDIEEHTHSSKT